MLKADPTYLGFGSFQKQIDTIKTIVVSSKLQTACNIAAANGRPSAAAKPSAAKTLEAPTFDSYLREEAVRLTISDEAIARGQIAPQVATDLQKAGATKKAVTTIAIEPKPAVELSASAPVKHTPEEDAVYAAAAAEFSRLSQQAAAARFAQQVRGEQPKIITAPDYVEPAPSKFASDGNAYFEQFDPAVHNDDLDTQFGLSAVIGGRKDLSEVESSAKMYNHLVAYYASEDYQIELAKAHDTFIKIWGDEQGEKTFQAKKTMDLKQLDFYEQNVSHATHRLLDVYEVESGALPSKGVDGLYHIGALQLTSRPEFAGRPVPYAITMDENFNVKISVNGKDISDRADITDYRNDQLARDYTRSAANSQVILYQYVSSYNTAVRVDQQRERAAAAIKEAYIAVNGEEAFSEMARPIYQDQILEKERQIQKELRYIKETFNIEGNLPVKGDDGLYVVSDFALTKSGEGYSADTPNVGWSVRVTTTGEVQTIASGGAIAPDGFVPANVARTSEERARLITVAQLAPKLKAGGLSLYRGTEVRSFNADGTATVKNYSWAGDHVEVMTTNYGPSGAVQVSTAPVGGGH